MNIAKRINFPGWRKIDKNRRRPQKGRSEFFTKAAEMTGLSVGTVDHDVTYEFAPRFNPVCYFLWKRARQEKYRRRGEGKKERDASRNIERNKRLRRDPETCQRERAMARERYRRKAEKERARGREKMKRRRSTVAGRIQDEMQKAVYSVIARKGRGVISDRLFAIVGCSVLRLMMHLEHHFQPGMTWENYGQWHIDHIKPFAKFDLTQESEQRACFHFTNLQPLWAVENLSKGAKWQEAP